MAYFDSTGHLLPEYQALDEAWLSEEARIAEVQRFGDKTPEELAAELWQQRQSSQLGRLALKLAN